MRRSTVLAAGAAVAVAVSVPAYTAYAAGGSGTAHPTASSSKP